MTEGFGWILTTAGGCPETEKKTVQERCMSWSTLGTPVHQVGVGPHGHALAVPAGHQAFTSARQETAGAMDVHGEAARGLAGPEAREGLQSPEAALGLPGRLSPLPAGAGTARLCENRTCSASQVLKLSCAGAACDVRRSCP